MEEKKVRWQREEKFCVPYVFEDNKWKRYNCSSVAVADKPFLSKGYATFVKALKSGYKLVKSKK